MDNLLLSNLPGDALASLHPHFERISLRHGQHAIVPDEFIRHFYFPVSCLLSMVTTMQDGASVECNTIGREGTSGIPVLLDAVTTPMPTFCQVPGEVIRVKAEVIKDSYERDRGVRKYFNRYIHTVIVNGSHSAACNRLHGLEERLARWLLLCQDRIGGNELRLTQEFLAQMLGTRRSRVSEAAIILQRAGLIHYSRGIITILDREGLEEFVCECYKVVKSEFDRLFSNQQKTR